MSAERCWLYEPGLPQRPWFRNLYAATDPDSGYAAWMLPGLRYFIEPQDPAGLAEAQRLCVAALGSLSRIMETIDAQLGPPGEGRGGFRPESPLPRR